MESLEQECDQSETSLEIRMNVTSAVCDLRARVMFGSLSNFASPYKSAIWKFLNVMSDHN